jgi:hypothetical protein
MKLKQKKNLESVKGNPFSTLQFENLNQIALDVNLKFGDNSAEYKFIISNLISDDRKNYDNFIEENPDILLPINLDLESIQKYDPNNDVDNGLQNTAEPSLKDDVSSPLWYEVVRKGKARSKSDKIKPNDIHLLEYYGPE